MKTGGHHSTLPHYCLRLSNIICMSHMLHESPTTPCPPFSPGLTPHKLYASQILKFMNNDLFGWALTSFVEQSLHSLDSLFLGIHHLKSYFRLKLTSALAFPTFVPSATWEITFQSTGYTCQCRFTPYWGRTRLVATCRKYRKAHLRIVAPIAHFECLFLQLSFLVSHWNR